MDEERVVKYRIKKIPALQTSKVAAVVYAPFGLFYTVAGAISLYNQPNYNFVGQVLLFGPVLLALFTFIATLFTCWFYNRVANLIGGIDVELEKSPSITIKQMKKDLSAAERRRGKGRGE